MPATCPLLVLSSLLFSSSCPVLVQILPVCAFLRFPSNDREEESNDDIVNGYRERLESTTVRDTRTFNLFPARACASESVKNKEAWKRGKDKGRDKGEGEEKEAGSWSLETR